jgi:hypothetical protein
MCSLSVEDERLESARNRALSIDGGPMWFKWIDQDVGIIGDWVGQLGESGEYWMRRVESGLDRKFEAQGGSPRLCRLSPVSVEPE